MIYIIYNFYIYFFGAFKFEGTEGEWFQKLTARFCSHQSWALDQIKSRQKKEARFNAFIQVWLTFTFTSATADGHLGSEAKGLPW